MILHKFIGMYLDYYIYENGTTIPNYSTSIHSTPMYSREDWFDRLSIGSKVFALIGIILFITICISVIKN